jgi:hypothetical protein
MTYAEIDAALSAKGVRLDPWDESFMDGQRPLDWDEVLSLLPDATEDEISAWAEDRGGKPRAKWVAE